MDHSEHSTTHTHTAPRVLHLGPTEVGEVWMHEKGLNFLFLWCSMGGGGRREADLGADRVTWLGARLFGSELEGFQQSRHHQYVGEGGKCVFMKNKCGVVLGDCWLTCGETDKGMCVCVQETAEHLGTPPRFDHLWGMPKIPVQAWSWNSFIFDIIATERSGNLSRFKKGRIFQGSRQQKESHHLITIYIFSVVQPFRRRTECKV